MGLGSFKTLGARRTKCLDFFLEAGEVPSRALTLHRWNTVLSPIWTFSGLAKEWNVERQWLDTLAPSSRDVDLEQKADHSPSFICHSMSATQSVSTFGKKKTATAVAHAKEGKGLIRVNGQPISLVEPQILRWKVYEPVLIVGEDKFS